MCILSCSTSSIANCKICTYIADNFWLTYVLKWRTVLRKNWLLTILCAWQQGLANTGRQVALASKFCTVAHNVCGSSVWNLFNPLNAEINPIGHLLTLLGAHHIFHVSGLRLNVSFSGAYNFEVSLNFFFFFGKFLNPTLQCTTHHDIKIFTSISFV